MGKLDKPGKFFPTIKSVVYSDLRVKDVAMAGRK
jgi:hypothetical protein